MPAWTGQRGHDGQNKAAGAGNLGQDNWDKTTVAGQQGQDSRNRAAGTGKPVQVSLDKKTDPDPCTAKAFKNKEILSTNKSVFILLQYLWGNSDKFHGVFLQKYLVIEYFRKFFSDFSENTGWFFG